MFEFWWAISSWNKTSFNLMKCIIIIINIIIIITTTYLLPSNMEQGCSWEANQFAASQWIPSKFMEPEVSLPHSQVPATCPILSQLDPFHIPTSHFLRAHLNIILPSAPGSPLWSLSLRFPHQNLVQTSPLPHMCHMPCPYHSFWFHHSHNIGGAVEIIKFLRL